MAATWPSIMPLGRHDVGSRRRLGQRDPPVQLDRRIVEDLTVGPEHAAVAVVGVLVEAEVGHQDELVPDGVAQGVQGALHDPVRAVRLGPGGVLRRRHPEEDETRNAERDQPFGLDDERVDGVLGLAGHGCDGHRFVDPLAHEQGGDEVVDAQSYFGDQPTEGRRTAKAAEASGRHG